MVCPVSLCFRLAPQSSCRQFSNSCPSYHKSPWKENCLKDVAEQICAALLHRWASSQNLTSIIYVNYINYMMYEVNKEEMHMLKKISAMKARQNLGQLLNEVSIRGDAYVIERAGKPLAALVDMESFQQLQVEQNSAGQAVRNIWKKMKEADATEVQEAIDEASQVARKKGIRERS
jgi:prevent-host-death family protein